MRTSFLIYVWSRNPLVDMKWVDLSGGRYLLCIEGRETPWSGQWIIIYDSFGMDELSVVLDVRPLLGDRVPSEIRWSRSTKWVPRCCAVLVVQKPTSSDQTRVTSKKGQVQTLTTSSSSACL